MWEWPDGDLRNGPETEWVDIVCYTGTGGSYRGSVAQTNTGRTCQSWGLQSPQTHETTPDVFADSGLGDHNYCRNPDGSLQHPWCYTTDPDVRREPCDQIQRCEQVPAFTGPSQPPHPVSPPPPVACTSTCPGSSGYVCAATQFTECGELLTSQVGTGSRLAVTLDAKTLYCNCPTCSLQCFMNGNEGNQYHCRCADSSVEHPAEGWTRWFDAGGNPQIDITGATTYTVPPPP